jgi:hypothetical protein
VTDEELSHLPPRGVPLDQAVVAEVQARQANRLAKATENLVTATRYLVYATWAFVAITVVGAVLQIIKGGR